MILADQNLTGLFLVAWSRRRDVAMKDEARAVVRRIVALLRAERPRKGTVRP